MGRADVYVVCVASLLVGILDAGVSAIRPRDFIRDLDSLHPGIAWDPLLQHLATKKATCRNAGKTHFVPVKRTTEDGAVIHAYVDGTFEGGHDDVTLKQLSRKMTSNMQDPAFVEMVRASEKIGCHINYQCVIGKVVACLFSNRVSPITPLLEASDKSNDVIMQADDGVQAQQPSTQSLGLVRAFTEQQYRLAEGIVRVAWDRTHLLENLSGVEAECAMAGQSRWPWSTALKFASQQGFNMKGVTSVAPNGGNVEEALRTILQDIKDNAVNRFEPYSMGCCLIPNCPGVDRQTGQHEEEVLVACIFRLR